MNDLPVTESEVAELLTQFGEYTKGKGARDFIGDGLDLVATNVMLLKAQEHCTMVELLQLIAWGVFLAETRETHLTPVHH